jgi:hypothetical protein
MDLELLIALGCIALILNIGATLGGIVVMVKTWNS